MQKTTTTRERGGPGLQLALDFGERRVLGFLGEVVVAGVAALGALVAWGYIDTGTVSFGWVLTVAPWVGGFTALWVVAATAAGRFRSSGIAARKATLEVIFLPAVLALGLYLTAFFFAPRTLLPRLAALIFIGTATVLTWGWRTVWSRASAHPIFERRVLIVGAAQTGRLIAEEVERHASAGWRVVGFVDDDPDKLGTTVPVEDGELPVLGTSAELPVLAERYGAREIVLGFRGRANPTILASLMTCQEQGVGVVAGLEVFEALTGRIPVDHVGESWHSALPLRAAGGRVLYAGTKRVIDVVVSVVGLTLFAVLLPFVALLIRVDSRGPVFYRQDRVGRNGRVFTLTKLRTMHTDAEQDEPVWAQVRDPRTTRVGRWLRRLRIDEVPQLWNVLIGDMSLVGPRPERPAFEMALEQAIRFYRLRYTVKPGLTGWATLHNGYIDSTHGARLRLEYDLYYMKHQSLGLDAQILVQTLLHVFTFKGR